MLSRLALHAAGALAPALKNAAPLAPGVLQASRIFHTASPHLAPLPPLPEHGGKIRHGLIPEEFFGFMYPKTGVTGPYVLGTGLILYLLSKEIYVITADTVAAMTTLGLFIYVVKKYGPSIASFADKLREDQLGQAEGLKQASLKGISDAIELEKKQQALVAKRHYLFDVQRNNIAMTLEVFYRERLHKVYTEVKNRLDYHIAKQNMMRRKEQEHMISWVENHVMKSISAQEEKETITKCIADLKVLAKKAQAQSHFLGVERGHFLSLDPTCPCWRDTRLSQRTRVKRESTSIMFIRFPVGALQLILKLCLLFTLS
uniref:ATP synthase subunit b n=1 Tax=Sarcophilus harrisii TaxID=9305 RepID=G3WJ65_SARHA